MGRKADCRANLRGTVWCFPFGVAPFGSHSCTAFHHIGELRARLNVTNVTNVSVQIPPLSLSLSPTKKLMLRLGPGRSPWQSGPIWTEASES
jgi:hypothetical protein